jgi:hypothetical protein
MLGALAHRVLQRWMLRVPSANMAVMPLIALTDFPFLFAFSPSRWIEHVRDLHLFQQHVTQRQWASLAEVYPRSLIWMYAYLLFTWGRYCHSLQEILWQPDRCLPAEMFIRYVCEIDRYVDSFDSRALWRAHATQFKARSRVRNVATELCIGVQQVGLDAAACRGAIGLILAYRREALAVMQHSVDPSADSLAQVIRDKERIAGNLWSVWSRVLGCLYQIPGDVTENASQAFFNFGMALQIIDDLSDAPADYAVRAQNLFLAVAQTYPAEHERLEQHFAELPSSFLDWPWACRYTPATYQATLDLFQGYFDRLHCDTYNATAAQRLCVMLDRMRTLGG